MYRSSMSGNPLNTTPYFNQMTKEGIFFDRCFTPSFPTARGVWATITSLPDVLGDNNRTASRNPELVNQRTIINDFKNYEKLYLIGGDPTWANIKGLLMNNIDGLKLYSQDDFKAQKANVWGIDDRLLLLESNKIFAQQQKPFFAIVQTADNHRPYTYPKDGETSFKEAHPSNDSLLQFGFEDEAQFNAFRYTDYCFEQFMEAAKKEAYFKNTIFVFVGDHGMPGNSNNIYPKSWNEYALTREHVPLLFYAPNLLQPQLHHQVVSQLDIMPSLATLAKVDYQTQALGRNIFDTTGKRKAFEFIIDHESGTIGVINKDFYYTKKIKGGLDRMVSVVNNEPVAKTPYTDTIRAYMSKLTDAYYETARYLLYNNKRK
jgi:phosphoglycerol transferase MdoB-like AlkP superfamily enzyme